LSLQNHFRRKNMPITELYHIWKKKLTDLRPQERITRLRNFSWLLVGLYTSQSVHQSKIAAKLPGQPCLPSRTRRLARLLDNPAFRVREWYYPLAQGLLQSLAAAGEVRLIVDGSAVAAQPTVGFGHQLLMVAVAYRKRAIPLAWTWVKGSRGHSSGLKQVALLAYVHSLLPPKATVLLVGEAEFGAVAVQKQLKKWHWAFVLRQKGQALVFAFGQRTAHRLDRLVSAAGDLAWLPQARLTQQHRWRVNVLAYWQLGEKQPWLLTTNLPQPQLVLRAYRRRMWVEEMFGDLKGHGFDLESTHLHNFLRLSRLTLAFGAQTIKNGHRRLVDRNDRRDYSLFRIGWHMADRRLINEQYLQISFHFCL
jgi:hypothetical protein